MHFEDIELLPQFSSDFQKTFHNSSFMRAKQLAFTKKKILLCAQDYLIISIIIIQDYAIEGDFFLRIQNSNLISMLQVLIG